MPLFSFIYTVITQLHILLIYNNLCPFLYIFEVITNCYSLRLLLIYNNNMGRLYNMKRKKLKELCLFICNNINNNTFIEDLGKYQICYKDSNNDWIIK